MRYLAQRLGGPSHGVVLESELPLTDASRGRALSAPPGATGSISAPLARLIGPDGKPLIRKWRTAIYAIEGDIIRGGYVVTDSRWNGETYDLTMAGFTAYPKGQPFSGVKAYTDSDPMDIFRDIWADLAAQPDGPFYMQISGLTSPLRVGGGPRDVNFTTGAGEDVSFTADDQSIKLNWWSTFDCGQEIDNLAANGFDWRERHDWDDGLVGGIAHYVDLGYPSLGARQDRPRLVYRENVLTPPDITDNPGYATDVVVLGAGEGKDRVRGYAGTERDGVRRTKVVEDADIGSVSQANARAVEELAHVRDGFVVDTLIVERHPNADIDALEPGHEVQYYAETDAGFVIDQWVKIVNIQETDSDPDRITVTVVTP